MGPAELERVPAAKVRQIWYREIRIAAIEGEGEMVIAVDPTLDAALTEEARRKGIPPEALALQALRERFLSRSAPDESRDDWERRLRGLAVDCGVSLSDLEVSSEGIYD